MRSSCIKIIIGTIITSYITCLTCLNAYSEEWVSVFENSKIPYTSGVAISGSILVVVDMIGNITAIQNGNVIWQKALNEFVVAGPVMGPNNTLYILTEHCSIYALNYFQNGILLWKYEAPPGETCKLEPVVSSNSELFIATQTGKLLTIVHGTLKSELDLHANVLVPPSLSQDGTLYVVSNPATVYAIQDNEIQSEYISDAAIKGQIAITAEGDIIIATQTGYIHKLSKDALQVIFSKYVIRPIDNGVTIDQHGNIHFTMQHTYAVINSSGTTYRAYPINIHGSILYPPIITNQGPILVDLLGNVYELNMDKFDVHIPSPLDTDQVNGPAYSDHLGYLYIATNAGRVFKVQTSPMDMNASWPAWEQYPSRTSGGQWPKLCVTTHFINLAALDMKGQTTASISVKNCGSGMLTWEAKIAGIDARLVPDHGETASWTTDTINVVVTSPYPKEGDFRGMITITDGFSPTAKIPVTLSAWRNPICVSETVLSTISNMRWTLPVTFSLSACQERFVTYTLSGPSWLTIHDPYKGKLDAFEFSTISLDIPQGTSLTPDQQGLIRIQRP